MIGVPVGVIVIVILGMPVITIPIGTVVRAVVVNIRRGRGRSIDSYFGGTASE